MEFYLAGEITQVIDSIPWVRCASSNVFEHRSKGGVAGGKPMFKNFVADFV